MAEVKCIKCGLPVKVLSTEADDNNVETTLCFCPYCGKAFSFNDDVELISCVIDELYELGLYDKAKKNNTTVTELLKGLAKPKGEKNV